MSSQVPAGLIDHLASQPASAFSLGDAPATAPTTPSLLQALNPGSIGYMLFFGAVAWGGAQLAEHLWASYGRPMLKNSSSGPEEDEEEPADEREFGGFASDPDDPEDEEEDD